MARPVVAPFTLAWWRRLPAFTRDADAAAGWPLLRYLSLLGDQAEQVSAVIASGGARLGDPATADARALGWLAMAAGVDATLYPDPAGDATYPDHAKLRAALAYADDGRAAGSTKAVLAAVRPLLSGSRIAEIVSRDPATFSYTVRTYAAQTPDPAAVAAVLQATLPASLQVTHLLASGQDFHELIEYGQTFADLRSGAFAPASGPTFAALRDGVPDPSGEVSFGALSAAPFESGASNTFARLLRPAGGRDTPSTVASFSRLARRRFSYLRDQGTFRRLTTEPS